MKTLKHIYIALSLFILLVSCKQQHFFYYKYNNYYANTDTVKARVEKERSTKKGEEFAINTAFSNVQSEFLNAYVFNFAKKEAKVDGVNIKVYDNKDSSIVEPTETKRTVSLLFLDEKRVVYLVETPENKNTFLDLDIGESYYASKETSNEENKQFTRFRGYYFISNDKLFIELDEGLTTRMPKKIKRFLDTYETEQNNLDSQACKIKEIQQSQLKYFYNDINDKMLECIENLKLRNANKRSDYIEQMPNEIVTMIFDIKKDENGNNVLYLNEIGQKSDDFGIIKDNPVILDINTIFNMSVNFKPTKISTNKLKISICSQIITGIKNENNTRIYLGKNDIHICRETITERRFIESW